MENPFEKYYLYKYDKKGDIVSVNDISDETTSESFELFKELYDNSFGSIEEDENLVSIHTGGWSENEELVSMFKRTFWWMKNHKITHVGGHYYFDTDYHGDKHWVISAKK